MSGKTHMISPEESKHISGILWSAKALDGHTKMLFMISLHFFFLKSMILIRQGIT